MNGMAVRGRSAGDPPRPRCVGENDPADAAGSAGVPGIRIDFRSGLKLQDYPVLRLSFVRILAGCVCDATLRRTRHTESAPAGPARRIYVRYTRLYHNRCVARPPAVWGGARLAAPPALPRR